MKNVPQLQSGTPSLHVLCTLYLDEDHSPIRSIVRDRDSFAEHFSECYEMLRASEFCHVQCLCYPYRDCSTTQWACSPRRRAGSPDFQQSRLQLINDASQYRQRYYKETENPRQVRSTYDNAQQKLTDDLARLSQAFAISEKVSRWFATSYMLLIVHFD